MVMAEGKGELADGMVGTAIPKAHWHALPKLALADGSTVSFPHKETVALFI